MVIMATNKPNGPVTYFGRQMKKERQYRGWSLREMADRTGVNYATLSRVETGHQPPTERLATECDRVFESEWFLEYYEESKSWVPASFRSWGEYEDKATTLHVWCPTVMHGLCQVTAYARAQLSTYPGVSPEVIEARLRARMERQARILLRPENPPDIHLVIDEAALYRRMGSPQVMAEQCDFLLYIAGLDHVRLHVAPAVENPCTGAEIVYTDNAAYTENALMGSVYLSEESVSRLRRMFDTLASECYRASESRAMVERMRDTWTELGARAAIHKPTGGAASKPPAATA